MEDIRITVKDEVTQEEMDELHRRLRAFNRERLENTDVRDIGVFVNEDGQMRAALTGDTHGDWLEIDFFFVDEALRGRGIGARMLKAAEDTAKERGCKRAFLNTFGFQAPGFYEKQGYKELFRLTDYPVSGTRHYMYKELV